MRILKDLKEAWSFTFTEWLQAFFGFKTKAEKLEGAIKDYLQERGWVEVTTGTGTTIARWSGMWVKGKGPYHILDHAFFMEREWQRRKTKPETPLGARNCRHGTPYTSPCERCDVEYARSEERV